MSDGEYYEIESIQAVRFGKDGKPTHLKVKWLDFKHATWERYDPQNFEGFKLEISKLKNICPNGTLFGRKVQTVRRVPIALGQ